MTKNSTRIDIIVLAAGLGTRMKSNLPKVLHRVCDKPMLSHLLENLDDATRRLKLQARFNIVIGHGRDLVRQEVESLMHVGRVQSDVSFTVQEQQLGTGHAVRLALENMRQPRGADGAVVAVFNGDLPMFSATAFEALWIAHSKSKSVATLASATLADAGQYGRIIRKGKTFAGTVEFKDASPIQRKIREYNGGVYIFDRKILSQALEKMSNKNASGEFYLPDVFNFAYKSKKKIFAHHFDDARVLAGVNNMLELADVQRELYRQINERHMLDGVFIADPVTTYISPETRFGKGCSVGPGTAIYGSSYFGDGVQIGPNCELRNVKVGDKTLIRAAVVAENAELGRECAVGPMAHFRPGTVLADFVRVGNFVEVKESKIGSHTNAAHLSYIGDAEIGKNVNLGCGFITCNFDGTVKEGRRKHRTQIGNDVFVGSDSQVVAPIDIADGTYIASGSTVTESVPEKESLVIARERQVTKPGYARKYRREKH